MGTRSRFSCSSCGYETDVSGGKDIGFVAVVETMICNDCTELVDVLVSTWGDDPQSSELRSRFGKCPKCGKTNATRWDPNKMPCPKCGNLMQQGEVTVYWD